MPVLALASVVFVASASTLATADGFVASPFEQAFLPPIHAQSAVAPGQALQGDGSGGCASVLSAIGNTGPIYRDGDLLYVGENGPDAPWTIHVVNIATPGAEFVEGTIDAPVDPVDVAVVDGEIFVINQDRTPLYYRDLAGGEWQTLDLPAKVTQWSYGNIMFPDGAGRIFVIHMWEDTIDVVDIATKSLITTITDLEFLPNRLVFADGKIVVLGVGLNAPTCGAFGPNFSVFDAATLEKDYQMSVAGECAVEVLAGDGKVFVVFNESIKSYDLATGELLDTLPAPGFLGRHAELHEGEVFAQFNGGLIVRTPTSLEGFLAVCDVMENDQVWIPPLEEMTFAGGDDRLFITNRNDDSISILDIGPPCPGDVNGDSVVDSTDLNLVLGAFGCGTTVPDSDCCFDNGSPGCDDPECEAIVCDIDPFCCQIAWDGVCVGEAIFACGDLCAGLDDVCPTDLDFDNDTDSNDLNAVLSVFGTDCNR